MQVRDDSWGGEFLDVPAEGMEIVDRSLFRLVLEEKVANNI